jgi:CheY-like chemotaxis protein
MQRPISVFVVEDSPLLRERIIQDVDSLGCRVVGAAESEGDAIASIEQLRPAVIVTDIQLRKGSGIGVVRKVRTKMPQSPPLIIVLTNYATAEYRDACIASGADEFLDKSSEYDRFLALMKDECHTSPQSGHGAGTAH